MTVGDRVIERIMCIFKKKGAKEASSPRPVKVVVTQGKITVTSLENKFHPIVLKTSDVVSKPKEPKGKSVTWLSLDCIQHVHSKYTYINFQADRSKMDEVIDLLLFAWQGSNPSNDPNSSDLFGDDADEIAVPVHKPAPNKPAPPPVGVGRRTKQGAISVDPEGSAAHQSFKSDFNESKQKKTAPPAPLTSQMQGLFADYGIDGKQEVKPVTVHKSTGLSKLAQESATKQPSKKSSASNSYSNHAHKIDKNYSPVDTKMGMGDAGISEKSFYANGTSPLPPTTTRPPASAVRRPSTKDSLDTSLRQGGRVVITPGIRNVQPKDPYHFDGDDENQNVYPTPQKSLTSLSAANTFDKAFKKPHNASESSIFNDLSNSNANTSSRAPSRPPLGSSNSQVNSYSHRAYSESATEHTGPFPYKSQPNVGNSCYMNSSLQALAACPIFIRQLQMAVESLDKKSNLIERLQTAMLWLNNEHTMKGPVTDAFLRKVRECLWSLYGVFKEENGTGQQDSEECLTAILGAVSDECIGMGFRKRESIGHRSFGSPVKTPMKRLESDSPAFEGRKAKPAKCDPVDLFEVKTAKMKKCSSCGNTSSTEDKDHRIRLALDHEQFDSNGKPAGPWTVKCVQQMLTRVVTHEEIITDFKCENCDQKVDVISTDQFIHFGEYIIIVLIRFKHDEYGRLIKMQSPLRVPMYMEMGDYLTDEESRVKEEPHNETIMLDTEKSPMRESETGESRTPKSKVTSVTNDWIEEMDCQSPPASPVQAAGDSMECSEVKEEKNGEEGKEGEGGDEPMEEEEEKKGRGAKEDKKNKKDETIEIDSSQSNEKEEEVKTEGKEDRGKRESKEGAGREEGRRSTTMTSSVKKTTPPKGRLRMETPSTVEVTTMRKGPIPSETTPSRKRGRLSVGNNKKEEWLSTGSRGSRGSLSHSEPTRKEKRSRIEGRRSGSTKSPATDDVFEFEDDDEVVVDVEEDEKRRRRSSLENKPVWRTSEETKPKPEKNDDEFEFDEDDGEEPKSTKTPMRKKTGFNPPTKKKLFGGSNAKTDETDHSPTKSSMEQTGGGVKRKDETADETETKKTKTEEGMEDDEDNALHIVEDEEEEEMDEEEREKAVKSRVSNVTGRSKKRQESISSRNSKYEEEGNHDEDDDAISISDAEIAQMGNIVEEEQFGSQVGGFIRSEGEKESSGDEVVQETPPESQGEVNDEEGERMGAGKTGSTESLASTVAEEGTTWFSLPVEKEPECYEIQEVTPGYNSTMDALFLDTPNYPDGSIKKEPVKDDKLTKMHNIIFKSEAVEDADGEVKPIRSPHMSPVKRNEKTVEEKKRPKKEEQIEEEEVEGEESDEEKRRRVRTKNDKQMKMWTELFTDTDAPPPRDHIAFRPVDDRWMKAKCVSLGLDYDLKQLQTRIMARVRAQSNICKVTDAPGRDSIVEIDGDGNCLFRALAWWVTGDEREHMKMRKKIVTFMFRFPDEFGQRMTGEEGQKYTKESNNRMLDAGEWGTQCEIYGAATLLGVDIYTYHESRWKPYRPLFEWTSVDGYKVTRKTELNARTRFGLYLTNDFNLHYDVVMYMDPVAPLTDTCYRLLATVMHHGRTTEQGHYVADVYDQASGDWVHCDDSMVSKRKIIEVLADAMDDGYVLVYGKNSSVLKKKGVKC